MIKEIKFNGYSATPSDYDCPDGDLAVAMGVVPENGALRGIVGGTPVRRLYKMSVVYVHETSAYKHYITINEARTEIGWINGEGENTGTLITSATKIADVNNFVKVEGIGNTLMIVTKESITYCLWKDGAYKLLGDHIPDVGLSFGLVGHPRLYSQSYDTPSFESGNGGFGIEFDKISSDNIESALTDDNASKITSQVMAKVNKFIREQTVDKGRFCFPFLVRYALRLYDGTSLVCHSAPILMNPSTNSAPIVFFKPEYNLDSSFVTTARCDIMLMAADLDYAVIKTNDSEQLSNWKDIVKSIDVFISKPIYTYDQNGLFDEVRLSGMHVESNKFIGKLYVSGYKSPKVNGNYLMNAVTGEDEISLPLYEDTDGSATTQALANLYADWSYGDVYKLYFSAIRQIPASILHLPEFEPDDVNESIINTNSFFKLCSIPIEDIELETRKTIEIDNTYLDSLVAREVMTDDYLTHDRLMAKNTQVYNNRLHLSGVYRELFKGYPIQSMWAYKNGHYDLVFLTAHYSGNLTDSYGNIIGGYDFEFENSARIIIPSATPNRTQVITYIKEDGNVYAVEIEDSASSKFLQNLLFFDANSSYAKYFFYPNMNAFKMVIKEHPAYKKGWVIDLQPHPFLNGAFAYIGSSSAASYEDVSNIGIELSPDSDLGKNYVLQLNKLYVSEFNNPFYFPVLGIYSIGVGDILGISSATKALSEGQFGQFPLYAFTTDGVWAMEVSQTGSYSSVRPLTRDVCTNPNGITQIDGAVLFATDRGIMLLSGSETICISEILDSDTPFKLATLPRGEELLSKFGYNAEQFDIIPFKQFLTGCDFVYDYVHQKIYVFNPACAYCYVYSLESKAWGMQSSTFKSKVNSYPEALYMATDGTLLDLSLDQGTDVPLGALITRPLKLDSPDVLKTISSVIVRGNFRKGDIKGVVLYGSRDLANWFMVASSKDHFLRGFSGTAYKYFRIAIRLSAQNRGVETCITGCTIQYSPKQSNQLR